jgi:hypothetical protein
VARELDLEFGDPLRASPEGETRRRRRATTEAKSEADDTGAVETEIRSRLDRLFDRIVKAREAVEDEELAEVIREDADAMANGFISVTHNVPFLRLPLIMLLNILEPVLAFYRVARILVIRWFARRAERAAAQYAQEPVYENGVPIYEAQ